MGPGEDGDLTIKFRKAGYKIAYVPEASCLTNVPTNFKTLTKQRRRWEWAAVTFECRKHIDAANPFSRHFRLDNFFMMLERWLFNIILVYASVLFWFYLAISFDMRTLKYMLMTYYCVYAFCEVVQSAFVIYYSAVKKRDLWLSVMSPLMPFYYFYMKIVTLIAITEEIFSRRSFRDNFVPERVRNATWHW